MKDNCQFCLGAKGGVKGNENRFGPVVVCDYCSVLVLDIIKSRTNKDLDEALNSGMGVYKP